MDVTFTTDLSTYIEQKLIVLKWKIDIIIVGNFNLPLSIINIQTGRKADGV